MSTPSVWRANKLFRRTNEVVRLRAQVAQLQAENAALKAGLTGQAVSSDQAASSHREITWPVIIAPQEAIPVADIIRYELDTHEKLYQMGFEDARAAWKRTGRKVEGE